MAEAITPLSLSGSTDGIGIAVAGTTSGTADTVHTASATVDVIDEIWLWAHNTDASDVDLTVEWGNATLPMVMTVPAKQGLFALIPGLKIENSKTVKAYAATSNVIMLLGHVNRYTPS